MDAVGLTFVLNKLSDLLERQVGLIAGAEDEIRSLRNDLSLLTIFLECINGQTDRTTPLVDQLVDQLRRVSWKAENLVDQYILDVARHERKKYVKKVFTGCGMLSRRGELAKQAQDIKKTIDDILKNKERFGVQLNYGNSSDLAAQKIEKNALDRMRRNVEEEDVIGFDQQFHEVMEMLMPKGGVELRVVSIIGMGGLGKTTLARKIFKSQEIRCHFETKLWVVVSEHAEAKHVLKNILQILKMDIEKDDDDYLKKKLKEQLDGRRYLIVLDDLWTPKQWEDLKSYLPTDQKNGSRILLTSRIENVAYAASTDSTTYHLKPLGNADGWNLFCKKALKGKECPPNMVDIGNSIVSKCKGLPLAIIVLSGLLSAAEAEPSRRYWCKILDDTSWHPDADNDCSKILSMSYHNLPPHLRTCFLYVGVFPEDFEIKANEICLMWVAEGFVDRQRSEFEEDEAENYLINLANRNLIMISKRRSDGSIRSCRIHDLLRDLCIKEAERCNLYTVDAVGAYQNVREGIRRMTIHKSDLATLFSLPLYKGLRTLLEFNKKYSSNLRSVLKHLTVLRVLHVHVNDQHCSSSALVRLHNLILLRYLKVHQLSWGDLTGTSMSREYSVGWQNLSGVSMAPHISKLLNLQILNFKSEGMTNLPKGIWKLKLLRHVYVRQLATMPDGESSDDSLPYLQTLSCIMYEEHTAKMLSGDRFPNLRNLWVQIRDTKSFRTASLQSLPELRHLLTMKIRFHCYGSLKQYSKVVPSSLNIVALPSALTKIHLKYIVLTSDHWRLLGELKNLQVLKLSTWAFLDPLNFEEGLFEKQPLVFETEGFPQLLHLKLQTLHPALILRNGALRALNYLIIRGQTRLGMPALLSLPNQLWLSTTFRQIKIIDPSAFLEDYIQSLDASKRNKVTISNPRGY